jgi:hypothetical protein
VLIVGEAAMARDAEDLGLRSTSQGPGGERDRNAERLQGARWHVDNEPPALAFVAARERFTQDGDGPVILIGDSGIKKTKSEPEKRR